MICTCGERMEVAGMGSRRVEGEQDPVHTVSYRCPACGRRDFIPKLAADIETVRAEVERDLEDWMLLGTLPISEQVALWNEQPRERRVERARWYLLGTGRWPGDDNVTDARFDYVVDGALITFHVNLLLKPSVERVYFTATIE